MLCLRDMGLMLGEYWDLDGAGSRLRRRRCVRIPAHRSTAVAGHRRSRLTSQSHCNQVGAT